MKLAPFKKGLNRIYIDIIFLAIAFLTIYSIYSRNLGMVYYLIFIPFSYLIFYYWVLRSFIEVHLINNELIVIHIYGHFLTKYYYPLNKIIKVKIHIHSVAREGTLIDIYFEENRKKTHMHYFSEKEVLYLISVLKKNNIAFETNPINYYDTPELIS